VESEEKVENQEEAKKQWFTELEILSKEKEL